jgi:hypothetical protein
VAVLAVLPVLPVLSPLLVVLPVLSLSGDAPGSAGEGGGVDASMYPVCEPAASPGIRQHPDRSLTHPLVDRGDP